MIEQNIRKKDMIQQKRTFNILDMLLYQNIENSRFKKVVDAKQTARHCLEELLLKQA
jgi:hypothetical protein